VAVKQHIAHTVMNTAAQSGSKTTYSAHCYEHSSTHFSSVQFIQFHQIHYKSKRPIGYRISHSTIYIQILMHEDSVHKVTIII